jgi:hypothetical protein
MNARRIGAMLLIIAGIIIGDFAAMFPPAQLEARNTTVTTIGITPAYGYCHSCHEHPQPPAQGGGGGAGGGGTIHIGS